MKLAIVADAHIANHRRFGGPLEAGINRRCEQVLRSLEAAYQAAYKEDCQAMVVAGDVFDSARPEPQHIAAVQQVIQRFPDTPTYVLLGNHDMVSGAEGDHALGPLEPVATVVDRPRRIVVRSRGRVTVDEAEVWAVPFQPGRAAEWLPKVLAEMQANPATGTPASSNRVLVLHLGLQHGDTPPWLQGAHDSIPITELSELMEKHRIDCAVAGNWHEHRTFNSVHGQMVQVGALCPTGWDNPGMRYGTMAVYDSKLGRVDRIVSVPGPRFLTLADGAGTGEWAEALESRMPLYVRIKAQPEKAAAEQAWLDEMKQKGAVVDGEVEVDGTDAQVALRTAAGVAREATTVDEAVARYVGQMPLEDEALRPDVVARVKRYLGGAA